MKRVFINNTFLKFVIVGMINTIVGITIMFVFYNLFGLSYCSYILNKHFTFQNKEHGWKPLFRFTVNILTCYLLAYGIAKPCMMWLLANYSKTVQENISMLLGAGLFVIFNYLGQRFFAFKQH